MIVMMKFIQVVDLYEDSSGKSDSRRSRKKLVLLLRKLSAKNAVQFIVVAQGKR